DFRGDFDDGPAVARRRGMRPCAYRLLAAFAISAAAMARPALAHAEAPDSPPVVAAGAQQRGSPLPTKTATSWYGYHNLAVDGGPMGREVAVGRARDGGGGSDGVGIWLTGYLPGGPIVHAAHGRWGTAGASLLLRGTAPIILGLMGHGFDSCKAEGDIDSCDF